METQNDENTGHSFCWNSHCPQFEKQLSQQIWNKNVLRVGGQEYILLTLLK